MINCESNNHNRKGMMTLAFMLNSVTSYYSETRRDKEADLV